MGVIAKQSFYNAIYIYLGIGLGALLTIFLYPNILSPDQYGLTRVLVSASMIGAQFAHLGLRNVVIRFFPLFRRTGGKNNGLLFLAVFIPLLGFLLFSIVFWFFRETLVGIYAERSPLFIDYFVYILPLTLFILYFEVLNSYLRSLRDSVTGSLISEVILRIVVITVLGGYFFQMISFDSFILLFTLAYGLQPLLLMAALVRAGELDIRPRPAIMRRSLLQGMLNYGIYTLLGGLTTVIVWNVDIMMLGSLSGLEQTAVYAVAFYIGTVISVPQRAIEKIATPLIAEHIRQKNWDEIKKIYQKTSLTQTIAGIFILLLIWGNAGPILDLLPDIYAGGHLVILYIGLGKLVDMATGTNGSIIIISRHYRFDLATNLLLVIFTVGTNLLLIPEYGINGAAVATMLSIFLYNLIKLVFVWITFSMQPFSLAFLYLLFLGSISLAVISAIPELPLILNLVITFTVLTLLFLLPVWKLELSDDLNRIVDRTLVNLSLRK